MSFEKRRIGPVWVTKYGLSVGILRFELVEQIDVNMIVHREGYAGSVGRHFVR